MKSSPERFELSRGNPMYLAGTRLNHSTPHMTMIAVISSLPMEEQGQRAQAQHRRFLIYCRVLVQNGDCNYNPDQPKWLVYH